MDSSPLDNPSAFCRAMERSSIKKRNSRTSQLFEKLNTLLLLNFITKMLIYQSYMIIGKLTVKSNEFNVLQLPFLSLDLSGTVFLVICGPTFFIIGHQQCFKFSESQQDGTSDEDSNSVELSFTKVRRQRMASFMVSNNLYD